MEEINDQRTRFVYFIRLLSNSVPVSPVKRRIMEITVGNSGTAVTVPKAHTFDPI